MPAMIDSSIVTGTLCPIIGAILVNGMWFSAIPALLQAEKNNNIGNINVFTFGNVKVEKCDYLSC